jgi:hypothetical protein
MPYQVQTDESYNWWILLQERKNNWTVYYNTGQLLTTELLLTRDYFIMDNSQQNTNKQTVHTVKYSARETYATMCKRYSSHAKNLK